MAEKVLVVKLGIINLSALIFIENTGALTSNGGSNNGTARDGGEVELSAAAVYNTGDINANFGPGYGDYNDSDSTVNIYAQKDLINSGDINVNGSDSDSDASAGGRINLYLNSSDSPIAITESRFANIGNLSAHGGNLTGDDADDAGYGGQYDYS